MTTTRAAAITLAAVTLLTACGTDQPIASPATPATSATTTPASPSPTPSWDPALKTGFATEDGPDVTQDRTYTFTAGGAAGERLRPGMWRTEGGPCTFKAPDRQGKVFEVDGGGWSPLPVTVRLPDGAVFTVVHLALFRNGGCIWMWKGPLD